jgi:hypothetical protein
MERVKHHLQRSELHSGLDACRIEVLMQKTSSMIEYDVEVQ